MRLKKTALSLSEASFELSQGRGSLEEVKRLLDGLNEKEEIHSFDRVTTDLEALVDSAVKTPGLRWRLNCLNVSLGSLRKGDFGFIFARPETGKTTFLCSEGSYMLSQSESPLVWFN